MNCIESGQCQQNRWQRCGYDARRQIHVIPYGRIGGQPTPMI